MKESFVNAYIQSIFLSDSRNRMAVPENLISGTSICDPSLIDSSFLAKKLAIYLPALCIFVSLSAPSELHTLKNHQIIAKNFEIQKKKDKLVDFFLSQTLSCVHKISTQRMQNA